MITICKDCVSHEYQDSRYGKSVRVMNKLKGSKEQKGYARYRCTVCSSVHTVTEKDK